MKISRGRFVERLCAPFRLYCTRSDPHRWQRNSFHPLHPLFFSAWHANATKRFSWT